MFNFRNLIVFCLLFSCDRYPEDSAPNGQNSSEISLDELEYILPTISQNSQHSLSLQRKADAEYIRVSLSGDEVASFYISHDDFYLTIPGIGRASKPRRSRHGLSYEWTLHEVDNYASYGEILREAKVELIRSQNHCYLKYLLHKSAGQRVLVHRKGFLEASCAK